MVSKSAHIGVETSAEGGVMKSILQSLFGGESFFTNTFSASDSGRLQLALALFANRSRPTTASLPSPTVSTRHIATITRLGESLN